MLWRLSDSWFLGHCERILHVSVHLPGMMDCPAPLVFCISFYFCLRGQAKPLELLLPTPGLC